MKASIVRVLRSNNSVVTVLQGAKGTVQVRCSPAHEDRDVQAMTAKNLQKAYDNWVWEWHNGEGSVCERIELNGVQAEE